MQRVGGEGKGKIAYTKSFLYKYVLYWYRVPL